TFLDRCIITAADPGTGDFVETGAVTGFQTVEVAGGQDGFPYAYVAENGLGQWEYGYGTWNAGGQTFSRSTVLLNSLGNQDLINLLNPPQVMIGTVVGEDLISPFYSSKTSGYTGQLTTGQTMPIPG